MARSGRASSERARAALRRDGYRCRYCGGQASVADHALGGNGPTDLVAACLECHGIATGRRFDSFDLKRIYILDVRARRRGFVPARCPECYAATYLDHGRAQPCVDCGALVTARQREDGS